HPDDLPSVVQAWRHAIATDQAFEKEARLRRADGQYRWHLLRSAPLRDAQGVICRWYGTHAEIEDRKQSERDRPLKVRHTRLYADVTAVFCQPAPLKTLLYGCALAIVKHLDAAFSRIWTLHTDEDILELQASAGMYTHLDGSHSRIPVGQFKI